LATLALALLTATLTTAAEPYFKIQVVDDQTGRGVPLVELTTVNDLRYYTDSAGVVAFYEPGLMSQVVYFKVASHGYEFPADGFGFRGARLKAEPGGKATVKIKRLNIAERLYRVTGGGIYADSVLVGDEPPLLQPLLNAQVVGSDSVVNAVFRGRIYWFWGDTNRPSCPLGNFHVPGATSRLPEDGGRDPQVGVELEYFLGQDGFAKPTCQMPGKGPTWIDGLVVLSEDGRERMFAKYVKVEPPLTIYERGLVEFDSEGEQFRHVVTFPEGAPVYPGGHPVQHRDADEDFVYFPEPLPYLRVRADCDALADLSQYEAYTCFKAGSREGSFELERAADGSLQYGWRRDTLPLTEKLQQQLVNDGRLKPEEGLFRLQDADTGKHVVVHSSSVYWNDFRQRWVMIALETFGTSALGEVWYTEAERLEGPWLTARKVVTHDRYSFYNPKQHPMLAQDGGRVIFFEGTYVNTFSGNDDRTPRYNYNQVMYRLDLADPRLQLPQAAP